MWLYTTEHHNGVRATINKREDGQEWFLVEPAYIWLSEDQADADMVAVGGSTFVRIGGGKHEGKYIQVATLEDVLFAADDYEEREATPGI
jgi:hypothetical protein